MTETIARIKVVLSAAVTWITLAIAVLTIFSEEIAALLPEGSEDISAFILKVVAWLGGAVTIIRRVSPVLPSERGIL